MPSHSSKVTGNPGLIQTLVREITQNGPMNFARFMEMALYDISHGYYMAKSGTQDDASHERIGWSGDFFTAPELSPILAKTLVRQVLEIDSQLDHPTPFIFLEMGGGNGTFAKDFLRHCQSIAPDFMTRLSYQIVERSPYLRTKQESAIKEAVDAWMGVHVTWWSSIEQVAKDSLIGVAFSNELIDALPVHRVRKENQHLQEIFVVYQDGQFVEQLGPMSSPKLDDYIQNNDILLQEGQTSEIHLEAEGWMTKVAQIVHKGVVVTIDYGHTGRDYYRADRKDGTLLCYYQHALSDNPYVRVGEQDMTSHVNFSSLVRSGKASHLVPVGFTTLCNWLMGLGVEELVKDQDQESEDVRALTQLLRPHGMGKTFKVLVQQKGLETVSLDGLRYPAFFDDVL